jgi:hypothetical protein
MAEGWLTTSESGRAGRAGRYRKIRPTPSDDQE